ncbi:MAG: glycosyltransferase [Bdellovibrionales bacterium]|nr:glycosyltransferase [Bdellovibrionales bacterium]
MKLIIQIPCFNEAQSLEQVLDSIPKKIQGIDEIEILIIDDGSSDATTDIARAHGGVHVIRNLRNLGLARSFRKGIHECLQRGADIIVNVDGDNQYPASEIPKLIEPIVSGRADLVIGDRQTGSIVHFSPMKKFLQKVGSRIVDRLSRTKVNDVTSGFRAFSREGALRLTILSNYTYTLESLLQAESKGFTIESIKIETNEPTRESRLMKSITSYLVFSLATIIRVFTMYNPLRVFVTIGGSLIFAASILSGRFLYYYLFTTGAGKIQSLILAAILLISGIMVVLVGVLADLIQFNRRLLEDILERLKRIEYSDPH